MKNTLKRGSTMALLIAIAMMLMSMFAFADTSLTIKETYPANNARNTTKENMCVKVYFDREVGNAASKKVNADLVQITDKSGNKLPVKIYYHKNGKKYTNYALILVDTAKIPLRGKNAIQDNQYYTCKISKGFAANDGTTLAADKTIRFKTLNQRTYTMGYMVMMVLMFGGMMVFSIRQMRNQNESADKQENKGKKGTEEPFNPYKEAKRTGKSVQDVIAEHNKEEKSGKKKKKLSDEELLRMEEEKIKKEMRDDYFKVKAPAPIAAAGAKYRTGRAAQAEARRKKEAAEKAARKASGYGKEKRK